VREVSLLARAYLVARVVGVLEQLEELPASVAIQRSLLTVRVTDEVERLECVDLDLLPRASASIRSRVVRPSTMLVGSADTVPPPESSG
jgi:hypothetical protein